MIKEYSRVIGKRDDLTVVGIAVDVADDCICIEQDKTNDVYMFAPSEVEKVVTFGKSMFRDFEFEKKVLERLKELKEAE